MNRKFLYNLILIIIFIIAIYFAVNWVSSIEIGEGEVQENEIVIQESTMNNEKKVEIEIIKEGQGEESKNGDTLSVHYTGTFENGEKFDSSLDRGEPFEFVLGQGMVIEGWEQGMLGMKAGEKRKLFIPYELGYGENWHGQIPAKSNLIFEVELLEIK